MERKKISVSLRKIFIGVDITKTFFPKLKHLKRLIFSGNHAVGSFIPRGTEIRLKVNGYPIAY